MKCDKETVCGGCPQRGKTLEEYQEYKKAWFLKIMEGLNTSCEIGNPIFIADGSRRRASMAFKYSGKKIILGFNQRSSSVVEDIPYCPMLTQRLNAVLADIKDLLKEICSIPYSCKRGKKNVSVTICQGDVWLCETENGIDVVLEYDAPLELEHRMIIFEKISSVKDIIRLSHRRKNSDVPEPIIEKSKPYIKIGDYFVYIPAGTFLQPSAEGEKVLRDLVKKHLVSTKGKIFDLFCGVGTFSYSLSSMPNCKIVASDSSKELLSGFQETINRNQITNIEVLCRNLFKYPFDETELRGASAVVIDPPRAGAQAQVKLISSMDEKERPQRIIMISCNPHSFVSDANILIAGGYILKTINMVDQFVYSNHNELVALFTNS